jgi:hypothetical protein
LTLRHHFSGEGISPFVEIKNLLDVRVWQQTEEKVFPRICYGTFTQTCVDNSDYREASKNNLLVWRQTFAAGLRVRMGKHSWIWSEGVQWEVTPGRETSRFGPPARGIYLASTAGFTF